MKNGSKVKERKRAIVTFEPMGPVQQMLTLALKGKPRGYKTRILEDAIAEKYREKYPKHYGEYNALRTIES